MNIQELAQKIDEVSEDTIAHYIEELPGRLFDMLDKSILISVGLKKDYNGYTIDYTNGREPLIANLVRDKAHAILHSQLENITPQLEQLIAEILPKYMEAIVKDIKDRMKKDIRDIAYRMVSDKMQEFCKALVDKEIKKYEKSMNNIKPIPAKLKEPENPRTGSTKLEQLLMRDMVEKLAGASTD